jgi:hypothetical protein
MIHNKDEFSYCCNIIKKYSTPFVPPYPSKECDFKCYTDGFNSY